MSSNAAVFEVLFTQDFVLKVPSLIITASGYPGRFHVFNLSRLPDIATRRFLHWIQSTRTASIYFVGDFDFHGFDIFRTYFEGGVHEGVESKISSDAKTF